MTGQGSRAFEAIQRMKDRSYINTSREYRTRGGQRVRALEERHTNKVKGEDGQPIETGHLRTIIAGQVWMKNPETGQQEWMARHWTHYGEDLRKNALYDLIEHHEKKAVQPTLFG